MREDDIVSIEPLLRTRRRFLCLGCFSSVVALNGRRYRHTCGLLSTHDRGGVFLRLRLLGTRALGARVSSTYGGFVCSSTYGGLLSLSHKLSSTLIVDARQIRLPCRPGPSGSSACPSLAGCRATC